MRPRLVSSLLLLLCAMLALARPARAGAPEELVIETANGPRQFAVEIATTPAERARGLMFRERLAPDAGMLFLYAVDQPVSMWMKNTLIPLDMLFIARDGRILKIAERTVPLSTTVIASDGEVAAVLELNGGTADRVGLRPGDRVRYAAFDGPD
jgi:uncharacterized membrane protein (UPF0127 family)